MKLVEAAGTGFAFPSQTTYFTRDEGLDLEKGTEAERQVDLNSIWTWFLLKGIADSVAPRSG